MSADAAYNDTHLYLVESDAQSRREWIAALDTIASLKPCAVIAGHKKPEKDDDPKIIEETRQYIRDFERLAQLTTTARVSLIQFGGHLPKGEYDVDHGEHKGKTNATELHRGLQVWSRATGPR